MTPLGAVVAFEWRAPCVAHAHARQPLLTETKRTRRLIRQVDEPVLGVRTAIVDAHQNRAAVLQVGHPGIRRHRQRRVPRRHRMHVVDLAVRGAASVEGGAVPGRRAGAIVVEIFPRVVPATADAVGAPNLVDAATLGDRTTFGDPRAGADTEVAVEGAATGACTERCSGSGKERCRHRPARASCASREGSNLYQNGAPGHHLTRTPTQWPPRRAVPIPAPSSDSAAAAPALRQVGKTDLRLGKGTGQLEARSEVRARPLFSYSVR